MREILFRGKRIDNGEWVEGLLARVTKDVSNIVNKEFDILIAVYTETIGQFTGLTDKNGKKIFEGDIIKWDEKEWGCPFSETVEWDYGLFAIRKSDWKEWCEIIGNIHEKE